MKSIDIDRDTDGRVTGVSIDGKTLFSLTCSNSPNGIQGTRGPCFINDEYVVKSWSSSYSEMRGEATLFIQPEDRKYFAETVLVGIERDYVVQKRVFFHPQLAKLSHQRILDSMLEKYDIRDVSTSYTCMYNCTVDEDGIPKIYDYEYVGY
jgi:hypothetical protein